MLVDRHGASVEAPLSAFVGAKAFFHTIESLFDVGGNADVSPALTGTVSQIG